MDLALSDHEEAFRAELRGWLADHPAGPEPDGEDASWAWRVEWQRTLAASGWAGVHWPAEYGGRGASLVESALFWSELAEARAPLPADVVGLMLAGPTLMAWGTDKQKARYLPPLLAGDETWCQGFSEPGAGSDLAAIATRACRADGGWVIDGQKVWTSFAQYARWCILIARTDPDSQRHRGLTFFIVDMESPGLEQRPLHQINGDAEFSELFLDSVYVRDEHVVGEVGDGWTVALTTLMNERAGISFFLQVHSRQMLEDLIVDAHERRLLDDPSVAGRLGELYVKSEAIRLMALAGVAETERTGQPGAEGSLTKWLWADTTQQTTELAVDVVGPDALMTTSPWSWELLRARANSIEGGTTEIQKSIVAERILGLPRSR
jgi:alkylation response protein AidB-like acyl-CoA dehydrogenase